MKIPGVAPTLFTRRESTLSALKNGAFASGVEGFLESVWCEQIYLDLTSISRGRSAGWLSLLIRPDAGVSRGVPVAALATLGTL
jgi:hypothetical protein